MWGLCGLPGSSFTFSAVLGQKGRGEEGRLETRTTLLEVLYSGVSREVPGKEASCTMG